MKGKQTWSRKLVSLFIIVAMLTLAACSGGSGGNQGNKSNNQGNDQGNNTGGQNTTQPGEEKQEPLKLSIMVPAFSTELPDESSPVWQKVEEYTDTDIEMRFVPNSSYEDMLNITLASTDLPTIMNVGKTPSVISAVRAGAFWELGPYLKDYPNLSQAHEVVLNNSSIDGKIYGIYRARTLGRMGVSYNQVWLDNLGLQPAQ